MASLNDQKVLAFMFDPFLLDAMNNEEEKVTREDNQSELTASQLHAKQLEVEGIAHANANRLQEALDTFGGALAAWPQRASIYNNRAQVHRLMNNIDAAKLDLDQAILLSDGGDGATRDEFVARQAYCQRALINLLRENKEQGMSDMAKSAAMGNGFAKSYMAKLNPYAALCNQMLQQMFEEYRVPGTCSQTNGH